MRKLLAFLLLLVLLAVAADFAGARLFEQRVAEELQREYRLDRRPVVGVRDMPFLVSLARGRFDTIDLAGQDVRTQGVIAQRLELHLHDVTVAREVMTSGSGTVRVGWADGRVTLSEAEINRLLADRLQGGTVEVTADGVRVLATRNLLGREVRITLEGTLGARDGQVTFKPVDVELDGAQIDPLLKTQLFALFSFEYRLPPLPAGIKVERVATATDAVIVSGRVGSLQVEA